MDATNGHKPVLIGKQPQAIMLVAADQLTDRQIAKKVGIGLRTLTNWKHQDAFMQAVGEAKAKMLAAIERTTILDKQARIQSYADDYALLDSLMERRKRNNQHELLVTRIKAYGSKDNLVVEEEEQFDYNVIKARNDLRTLIAKELGELDDRTQVNTDVRVEFVYVRKDLPS